MKLNYTVQVGDFLLIHTTKQDAPIVKAIIESMTGLYSRHVIVYKRECEHMVNIIRSHAVINYNTEIIEALETNDWLRQLIIDEVEENIEAYEKRYIDGFMYRNKEV